MTTVSLFQASSLQELPFLKHGFFTRRGGTSTGLLSSLNFAFKPGETLLNIQENQRRALNKLGLSERLFCGLKQVHGNRVYSLFQAEGKPPSLFPLQEADALVTDRRDVVLGILTADCVPVLLSDTHTQLIGALHAGWRGALGGIVQRTLAVMRENGAKRIRAALGPSIQQKQYEVGKDVYDAFCSSDLKRGEFFMSSERPAHFYFDLPGFVVSLFKEEGVHDIERLEEDTYSQEELFFSCRRATHRGDPLFGGQLSAIALR